MSLATLITKLATQTVPAVLAVVQTCSVSIMRGGAKTADGRGGTTRTFSATAASPFAGVYAILAGKEHLEAVELAGTQNRPVTFYSFTLKGDADVTTDDRVSLAAHGSLAAAREMPVVRVSRPSGVATVVLCVFEEPRA